MRPIHVISVGGFGREVARRISETHPESSYITEIPPTGEFNPSLWPLSRVHILVAWRTVPRLETYLDDLAHAWHVPWIPVVAESAAMRLGPVVVPGKGCCHSCVMRRGRQHASRARLDLTERLHAYYDQNPAVGPSGFLSSMASLSAAVLMEWVEALSRDPAEVAGTLVYINALTLSFRKGRGVGIHGCPRCGLGRDEASRSIRDLSTVVDRLLGER